MSKLDSFFIFCSGVDKNILNRTPTDRNKIIGVGATVFFTGVFAWMASGYALYTVFGNVFSAFFFGLIWGLMIFNLDRYIVSSLKKSGGFWKDFGMAFPRLVLAIIISIVIAKPLELKIFETEINNEIVSMQIEQSKEHQALVKSKYEGDITALDVEISKMKSELEVLRLSKNALQSEALKEADGTGGSQIRNMGPIYKIKMHAAEEAERALQQKEVQLFPLITEKESHKNDLLAQKEDEVATLQQVSLTGLASRLEALSRLSASSQAIQFASIFLMLLFIAIETAPLFVKLITDRSPYDFEIDKIDVGFQTSHAEETAIKKAIVKNKIEYETRTKLYRNHQNITSENELYAEAIRAEVEEIKKSPSALRDFLRRGKLEVE